MATSLAAQLVSLQPPNWRYTPILKFSIAQENLQQYPTVPLILSRLSFPAKAAILAVYPDISPRYISLCLTGGISGSQPAAPRDVFLPSGFSNQSTARLRAVCWVRLPQRER